MFKNGYIYIVEKQTMLRTLTVLLVFFSFIFLFSNVKSAMSAVQEPDTPVSWVGPSTGYWDVPANWSTNIIPGASDDVTIGASNTVTYTTGTSTINTINCSGSLVITGGSLTVSGASTLTSLEIKGASAYFNGATTVGSLLLWGSTASEGILGGSGTMTITSDFDWYGRYPYSPYQRLTSRIYGPGTTILASSAAGYMNDYHSSGGIAGDLTLGGMSWGTGRVFENNGHIIQNGALRLAYGSVLDNKASGRIEHGGTAWISNSGGTLVNAGTFEIYSTFSIDVPVTNSGIFDVKDIGRFRISHLSNSGTIRGQPDCDIELGSNSGGPYTLAPSSVITATQGTVNFVGDQDWTIQGTYNVKTTRLDDYNSSNVTITPGTSLQIQDVLIHGGNLVMQKNVTLNDLTIRKGSVGFLGKLSGDGNVTVNGQFRWYGGIMEGPGSTTVNGTLTVATTELKTLGTVGKPRSLIANGTGAWSTGNIDASAGSPFTIQASHSLTARGILTGTLTNNGALSVGGSAGTLSITGSYQQGATGALNMELGGNNPGEYDLLEVGTVANLAGALNVTEINGYSLVGNNLDIITYASRSGSFTTLNLPPSGEVSYGPNALNVRAGGAPSSVTIDGPANGVIDQTYVYTATVSPSNATPPLIYAWDPAPDSGQGTNVASYTWSLVGNKTITATVSNAFGSVFDTQSVSILDVPISGLEAENDSPHLLGLTTEFSATLDAGTNVSFEWDFGDGSPAGSGVFTGHDYLNEGTYTAVVTATNTSGSAITSTQVTIWGTIPASGGTINPADMVTITFPSGAVTDTIVVQFEMQPDMTVPGMADAGIFYDLNPVYLADGTPAQLVPGSTYTITVTYDEADIPPGVDESSLAFYYWDGGAWVKEPSSVVDVIANTITATIDHFSRWGLLAPTWRYVYLPLVLKR